MIGEKVLDWENLANDNNNRVRDNAEAEMNNRASIRTRCYAPP